MDGWMKFIEGMGLYFTVFDCNYKVLVQAGLLLGSVHSILIHICGLNISTQSINLLVSQSWLVWWSG